MNFEEYLVPLIIVACLSEGYIIKHTPAFEKLSNGYIPLIVGTTGMILGLALNGFGIEAGIYGLVSGLASTGLHEVYENTLNLPR